MQVDRDLWIKVGREKLQASEKERDEARAEAERWKSEAFRAARERNETFNEFDLMQSQLDEARADVERFKEQLNDETAYSVTIQGQMESLKQGLRESVQSRNELCADLIKTQDEVNQLKSERDLWQQIDCDKATVNQQLTVRPEPSRLEIAALAMQGMLACSGYDVTRLASGALHYTDALIAAAAAFAALEEEIKTLNAKLKEALELAEAAAKGSPYQQTPHFWKRIYDLRHGNTNS